ncbi:MAG: hypothetical protein QW607_06095 [Desulfurococcaceae archaeon]
MIRELIQPLWEKYIRITNREMKIKKVSEIVEKMNINTSVKWYPETETAEVVINDYDISDYDVRVMLMEIKRYLEADDIRLVVTTRKRESTETRIPRHVIERARELSENIVVDENFIYIPLLEKDDLYIYVRTYHPGDC